MNPTQELDHFKRSINLSEYMAIEYGYEIDRSESSRNSVVMRGPGDDKIIVAKGSTGHFIYFSVRDERDNGSIVDFIKNRTSPNIGKVRQLLRAFVGESAQRPEPKILTYQPDISPTTKDRLGAINALSHMKSALTHPYLESRYISRETLASQRFRNKVFIDDRKNAVFPHFDEEGISGYEVKNFNFTGFYKGGYKTLWISNCFKQDQELIVVESAIDGLAHYELHKNRYARYLSMGGSWSEEAGVLLLSAVNCFPGDVIKLGFDNDSPGDELLKKAMDLLTEAGKQIIDDRPQVLGADWAEVLKSEKQGDRKIN